MNIKQLAVIVAGVLSFPLLTHAQTQAPPGSGEQPSFWGSLFFTILPIVFIFAFVVFILRRFQRPMMKLSQEHRAREIQHMERVEQSLDRIIQLLEKKN